MTTPEFVALQQEFTGKMAAQEQERAQFISRCAQLESKIHLEKLVELVVRTIHYFSVTTAIEDEAISVPRDNYDDLVLRVFKKNHSALLWLLLLGTKFLILRTSA